MTDKIDWDAAEKARAHLLDFVRVEFIGGPKDGESWAQRFPLRDREFRFYGRRNAVSVQAAPSPYVEDFPLIGIYLQTDSGFHYGIITLAIDFLAAIPRKERDEVLNEFVKCLKPITFQWQGYR